MRRVLLSLALALGILGFVAVSDSRAQFVFPYYGPPYYPYAYSTYYAPGYVPPYYWSGNYYVSPLYRSYYYGAYSPYTNTYFYNYRVAPRRWWWRR
jgi:hypothetical protein